MTTMGGRRACAYLTPRLALLDALAHARVQITCSMVVREPLDPTCSYQADSSPA